MCSESQSDILKQLDNVISVLREAREQAIYWDRMKNTCILQSYRDGKFSLVLDLNITFKINAERAGALDGNRIACVGLTAFVTNRDSAHVAMRGQSQGQQMFVRNIDIVYGPDNLVVPSIIWLDPVENKFPQFFKPGIYLNAVEGVFDKLPRLPDRETCFGIQFVGQAPGNDFDPREIERSPNVVDSIPDDQGYAPKLPFDIRDCVYNRLSTSERVILNCGSVSFFERQKCGLHLRNMFIGPLNFEPGIMEDRLHGPTVYNTVCG